MCEIVAEVYRSGRIESCHYGHVAVVAPDGELLAGMGKPQTKTYMRSAAKPFQVMPLLESGAVEHFGFMEKELAVIMASHNGEPFHIQTVEQLLQKTGLAVTELQCGFHPPLHGKSAKNHLLSGLPKTAIYNNCSGKHTGMLALAKYKGWPLKTYLKTSHPVQKLIKEKISLFSGLPERDIETGVDGCSAPVFYLPIKNMALMYADLAVAKTDTARQVFNIMSSHSEMIAGAGRFDTDLMRVMKGRMVSKVGAEGVRCLAVKGKRPLGIALKIEDGHKRVSAAVLLEILQQMDLISDAELQQLWSYYRPVLQNCMGIEVGEIRAKFELVTA